MPRGDKSKYTDKQVRKAEHIAESFEERGVPGKEAVRRAWATVNKDDGGGKQPGLVGVGLRNRLVLGCQGVGVAAAEGRQELLPCGGVVRAGLVGQA